MKRRANCNPAHLPALLACAAVAVVGPRLLWANDKNGVSPATISRPTGPGSLEGLGDAFQPAINTGTARYAVKFVLPEGVAGFTPGLSLRYDSGRGFGPAGIGWSFGPGGIRRQTEKGLPHYVDPPAEAPDRFIGMNDEELVSLANDYYLAKIEGAYLRYRRVGDGWEARAKDGTKLEFGLTAAARLTDPTGTKIYQWCLERQTDTNGNVIEYGYIRPGAEDRQIYLNQIRYGPGPPPWTHDYSVSITYEDRPDPRTDYRSGFKVRTTKRISRIDVKYDDTLIRRYVLGYSAHEHWSLLTTVTQYGDDGVSALPVTTFGYATLDLGDPDVPLSASTHVIGSSGEPGSVVDNAKVDLIDINTDGLPDLLYTDVGHVAYLNRGVRAVVPDQRAVFWEGPVAVAAEDTRAFGFELSESNVHLADMTGDGIADLVVTEMDWVEYFPNTGQVGWAAGRLMSAEHSPPPAPFGPDGASVLTSDLDFDKRIDVIKSDFGAYSVWFNLGGGAFSDEVVTDGAWHGQQFIDLADPGVQLADMNGDRLNDVVKVTPASVVYCANMGFGNFDRYVEMMLPDRWLDDAPGGNLHRAKLTDVNGDGLSDLVVERADGNNLWFWLNLGDGTFSPSRVITDLPATAQSATRWVDINGNGTTDLVYADSTLPESKISAVDLGELIAGSAHLNALTSIDNGYGRRTTITYRSTTDFYLDAIEAGNPWAIAVPFPVAVVSRTQTSVGLDLDGFPDEGPDGDVYLTDYVYRDGYYDPLEKQFRGFSFVKQIRHGDERFGGTAAPTLVTRYGFHTGAPDGEDNNGDSRTDEYDEWDGREEEPLKGVELWQETCALPDDPTQDGRFAGNSAVFDRRETTWEVRDLCDSAAGSLAGLLGENYRANDGYDRTVRQAVTTRVRRSIIERQTDVSAHRHLETRSDVDPLGNTTLEWNLGDLSNPEDDLYTGYEYARNEARWIVDRVSRTFQRAGTADGAFVSEDHHYYDGLPFQGLPLGEIGDRGQVHRSESVVSGGDVPEVTQCSFLRGDPRDPAGRVDTLRQRLDVYGNPVVTLDANATLGPDGMADGTGHERRIEYDALVHKFPVRETIIPGGESPSLEVTADYHYGLGTPVTVTDFNGNETHYAYDTFGRLEKEIVPGGDPTVPTHVYRYDLGAPVSSIETTAHTREGHSPDVVTREFFDGLGRVLGTFEVGGPVMKGVTRYDPRGQPGKVYQPYFGEPLDKGSDWLLPNNALPATLTAYDATGRTVETISPPDEHGVAARASTEYLPLIVIQRDGEDNREIGIDCLAPEDCPHTNTPKTSVFDGLERLVEVHEIETRSAADSGTFVTRYHYALPDLLAEIEDSSGNIKHLRYDGLGRRIFMNDCDRGHMTHTYDAVGNVLHTVDAKGQQTVFTYDGANRLLTEDYLDSGTPLSLERTPDVRYHYDRPADTYPMLRNVRGQVAWVEDQTGVRLHGFDARGSLETVVKRIDQPDGSMRDWTTVTLFDSLGRVYQTVYPDGSIVRQEYDARGLLRAVPGVVDRLTYDASEKKTTCALASGVVTSYTYDPRLRLIGLATQSGSEVVQNLSYDFDQADNILGVTDGRMLPPSDPRNQTAGFSVDNTYRLVQAVGTGYGTIEYDYDRLGNMVEKVSPDILDSYVHIGEMVSGGTGGTAGRIGRTAGDPPGPHALTCTYDGSQLRTYAYDDNGNMTVNDGDEYIYDFKNRIGRVIKNGRDIRYRYDHTDRRVIKRVDGVQTTYIDRLSEIRDGRLIKYVFAGATRVARVEGPIPAPERVSQRLSLVEGWSLFSFQVSAESTDPAVVLADLAGKYDVVYGHNGHGYNRYVPGGADNTLASILPNHGYWIHMTEPAELLIEGQMSETPIDVPAGAAALVGVPGLAPRSRDELRLQQPSLTALWTYLGDDVGWRSLDIASPAYVNTLRQTAPGLGYWISSDEGVQLGQPPSAPAEMLYYHADHLGSTNVTTDSSGVVVSETLYYPFGSVRYEDKIGQAVADPHYRFGDKERDRESGLHYFDARYYLAHVGRFLTLDPMYASPDALPADRYAEFLNNAQAGNGYAYVLNAPLKYLDPSGRDWVFAFGGGAEGNLVGGSAAGAGGNYISIGRGGIQIGTYLTGGTGGAVSSSPAGANMTLQASVNPGGLSSFQGESTSYGASGGTQLMAGGEVSVPDEGSAGYTFAWGAQTSTGGGAYVRRTTTATTPLLDVRFGSEVKTKAKSGSAAGHVGGMWSAMKRSMQRSMPTPPQHVALPGATVQGRRAPRMRNRVGPNAATAGRTPVARGQTSGPEDIYADLDQEPEDIYEP